MGIITATIYVDTSFSSGVCQTGYYIYFQACPIIGHTEVFEASDNNSAELKGIEKACAEAINCITGEVNNKENLDQFNFTVYNDNITAVTVADSNYKPSKKANGRFQSTKDIKAWCDENNVKLKCIRMRRGDPIMKKCDKLSKTYRKEKHGNT